MLGACVLRARTLVEEKVVNALSVDAAQMRIVEVTSILTGEPGIYRREQSVAVSACEGLQAPIGAQDEAGPCYVILADGLDRGAVLNSERLYWGA